MKLAAMARTHPALLAQEVLSLTIEDSLDYQAWIKQQREAAQSITCKPNGTTLSLIAHNISWNQYCLAVPANTPFAVNINNEDSGIQHNFSIYDSFFQKKNYFRAAKLTGPATACGRDHDWPPSSVAKMPLGSRLSARQATFPAGNLAWRAACGRLAP